MQGKLPRISGLAETNKSEVELSAEELCVLQLIAGSFG
jgi:hypothetical protein